MARATSAWCEVARTVGATPKEIDRLATAFEHDDLQQALALG